MSALVPGVIQLYVAPKFDLQFQGMGKTGLFEAFLEMDLSFMVIHM